MVALFRSFRVGIKTHSLSLSPTLSFSSPACYYLLQSIAVLERSKSFDRVLQRDYDSIRCKYNLRMGILKISLRTLSLSFSLLPFMNAISISHRKKRGKKVALLTIKRSMQKDVVIVTSN